MSLLIGTFTIGLYSFAACPGSLYQLPDLCVSGYYCGWIDHPWCAVAATLLVHGVIPRWPHWPVSWPGCSPVPAPGAAYPFQDQLPAFGILVMTALYSVNLHVMGKSNIPLLSVNTLVTQSERIGVKLMQGATAFNSLDGISVYATLRCLRPFALAVVVTGAVLYWFFRTDLGWRCEPRETMFRWSGRWA